MEIARLILEFLRVIVWPALVVMATVIFRAEIRGLLARIASMELPGGAKLSWDRLSPDQQRERADADVEELGGGPSEIEDHARDEDVGSIEEPAGESEADSPAQDLFVEESRAESANALVRQNALLAEDLVVRQLEAEFEVEIRRQVAVADRPDFQFDAVIYKEKPTVFVTVEVKFIHRYIDIERIVDLEFGRVEKLRKNVEVEGIEAILVFVVDADESIRSKLELEANHLGRYRDARHDIRIYDFTLLKKKFGG